MSSPWVPGGIVRGEERPDFGDPFVVEVGGVSHLELGEVMSRHDGSVGKPVLRAKLR